MDEKDWTCLATIFEEKNLTRSAEKLYISQPALTYRIRELEKELGVKIFVKAKGSVKFTKEGNRIAQYAKKMQFELNRLKADLQEMNQVAHGTLEISAGEIFSHTELPTILSKFHQLYPNIKFNISSLNPNNILDKLTNVESHITIIRSELEWSGPKLILRKDPVCIISKNPVSLHALPKMTRINMLLTNSSKKAIDDWWNKFFAAPPSLSMNVTKPEACIEMVKQDFGYAIFPLSVVQKQHLQNDLHVTSLHYKDGTPFELNLYAYYREETTDIKMVETFIKFLKEYFHQNS